MHVGKILIALIGVFLFLFTSVRGEIKDFSIKAFHLDFRAQVMTVPAIKELALDLSEKGINAIIIEYEATFPFKKHATLCNKYAYSRKDVKEIVDYCKSLGIDVIPLQNCFGHCEYILRHDRYINLREDRKEVSQVCPSKIDSAEKVFGEIFSEVASLHPSKYFHIGADETYLLGHCKECSKKDKSKLFVDYVKAMCKIVEGMGKTPIIWADIILKYPKVAHELPKNLVFVDWNYGWSPNHFGNLENLFKFGATVWGAPALRSSPDNIYLVDWMKHFNNLATFIPFAKSKGYKGIIDTSWSTSGLYGFYYDNNNEILEMYPVRQVYPMSGFQILIDAFCKAVSEKGALDPENFILSYAAERYGLNPKDSQIFFSYFQHPQKCVRSGKDSNGAAIAQLIQEIKELKDSFDKISVSKNDVEFEHYRLMLDLRINYLKYKEIEFEYDSPNYDSSKAGILKERLESIISESDELGLRFESINKTYLKPGQFEDINAFRTKKMKNLCANLARQAEICY